MSGTIIAAGSRLLKRLVADAAACICGAFVLSSVFAAASGAEQTARQSMLAITHVTVIDATGAQPKNDHTVVITGERITSIGPAKTTQVPAAARVVDGRGKYLIPGLWDLHVHVPFDGADVLPVFVAHGVTGIRELGRAIPEIEKIRAAGAAGTLLIPKIVASGNMIEAAEMKDLIGKSAVPVIDELFDRERIFVANADEARQAVDTLVKLKPDLLKLHQTMRRDVYFAVLDEAKRVGLTVVGHYPMGGHITLREIADAGQRSLEHLNFGSAPADFAKLGPDEQRALLAHVKARGVVFVPTLAIAAAGERYRPMGDIAARIATARKDPRARYVSPLSWQTWEVLLAVDEKFEEEAAAAGWDAKEQLAFLRILYNAGLPILPGTDFMEPFLFPGSSLHEELIELVRQVGMTPHEVLQSATRRAAQAVGLQDAYGTVETGKLADLVLLKANPLTAIENMQRIEAVVRGGRLLDRAALDGVLATAAARIAASR
jgi:imidazolonepropionase-like amidohydrolase